MIKARDKFAELGLGVTARNIYVTYKWLAENKSTVIYEEDTNGYDK